MSSRRHFLRAASLSTLVLPFGHQLSSVQDLDDLLANPSPEWDEVRQLFPITKWEKIQFNSGSAGVMPTPVQDYLIQLIRDMNSRAPYEFWGAWSEIKKDNIHRIAHTLGVTPEEIMIVRNTTEALNMIIYGLPLDSGDEFILAKHDYPFAVNAVQQRGLRDGIVPRWLDIELPADDDAVVEAYAQMITPKTKAILATYMTHRHGHIMPIRRLAKLAHDHDAQLVVDAAHAFAHFQHNLAELDADYYASSLHKWLNAPHGTGVIYSKKEHIAALHPHPSSNLDAQETMNKYEHLGTRAFHQEIGLSAALDFQDWLGAQNKQDRLHALKLYWTEKTKEFDRVTLHTDLLPDKSCAVATFSIDGLSGGEVVRILNEQFDIHAKSVGGKWGSGVRISVNVFTNFEELDTLVKAIHTISKQS